MANKYLYSGATGSGTGADWANAYTTFAGAVAGMSAGDDLWVASNHSESTVGSINLTVPSALGAPSRIICVNSAGSVPPVEADMLTGASITTTGASSSITISGFIYVYGLSISAGDSTNVVNITFANAAGNSQTWEKCTFSLPATSGANRLIPGNSATYVELINCTLSIGVNTSGIGLGSSRAVIIGSNNTTFIQGATLPTTLIVADSTSADTYLEMYDVDLSNLTSKTLITTSSHKVVKLKNCRLPSSWTISNSTSSGSQLVEIIGSNDTTNVCRNERYNSRGTLTTETTIKRTAGATDGTTAYSWKMVTTSNAKRSISPLDTFEGAIWNTATGASKTLTFHCVTDNVTLQNSDIWVEVEYLGSSSYPLATLLSSGPTSQLATGTNLTSDSGEAWTTTGLTTPVKQKFSVTFTPQMIGPIRWKIKVAKASSTVYVCPKPDLS